MNAEFALRRALRMSSNRNWSGRLVLATWVIQMPLFAFLSPESIVAKALDLTGHMGYLMMGALALLSLGMLLDAAIHDLVPGKLQQLLMLHRHSATMVTAIVLTMLGAALAARTHNALILAPFVVAALLCVFFTALDLRATHKEYCP